MPAAAGIRALPVRNVARPDEYPSTARVLRYSRGVFHLFVRAAMQPTDPFPVERCSPRLKAVLLAEFHGRAPTFGAIQSVSLKKWRTVPGIGPTLLHELEGILQSVPVGAEPASVPNAADADLLARIERLQRDLARLKQDVQLPIGQNSTRRDDPDDGDLR